MTTDATEQSPSKRIKLSNVNTEADTNAVPFNIPSDWPSLDSNDPIDLTVHDGTHHSADTEWWYINGHADVSSADTPPSNATAGSDTAHTVTELSFFASFFRIVQSVQPDGTYKYAHALTWSVVDPHNQQYICDTVLDKDAPTILKQQLEVGTYDVDSRFSKALLEMLSKGSIPKPDRCMKTTAQTSNPGERLCLNYDSNRFEHTAGSDNYTLQCSNTDKGIAIDLTFIPIRPVMRQAYDGVVKVGLKRDTMFYYFIPRMRVEGTITLNHRVYNVNTGSERSTAWYDHEFGGTFRADMMLQQQHLLNEADRAANEQPISHPLSAELQTSKRFTYNAQRSPKVNGKLNGSSHPPSPAAAKHKRGYAWNWFSITLDNQTDITITQLVDLATPTNAESVLEQYAIVIKPASNAGSSNGVDRTEHHNISISSSNNWMSLRTTQTYPLDWQITIPDLHLTLTLTATMAEQEVLTLISKPAFFEGRMDVKATHSHVPTANTPQTNGHHPTIVTGRAWLERQGFGGMSSLEQFFKNMGKETIAQVDRIIPHKPDYEQARHLIATTEDDQYMQGVNLDIYGETITKPLRDIVDRGGKSWRSLACLLCVDAVGGNSSQYRHWLVMPEIMHVGSLIIDDIQDNSDTRRGGPSCHKVYGNAKAINTGCAAYFLTLHILNRLTPNLNDSTRLKLYELYFLGLRAGHAGQGFDLYGLEYAVPHAVDSGDNTELRERVLCTHRLKSAVPASCLARMGATIGEGSAAQVTALGHYFEAVGLAFQILDDVLNVRGFAGNTKDTGEDVRDGKITFPVALAFSKDRLPQQADRQWLADTLRSKPTDVKTIQAVITKLTECGAVSDSCTYAEGLVVDAWKLLDAAIDDSWFKMMLRAFGLYVLQRQY